MTVGPFPFLSHEPAPKGCICPPGSEATCQRSDCGRKDHRLKILPSTTPPIKPPLTEYGLCTECGNPADLCECGKPS